MLDIINEGEYGNSECLKYEIYNLCTNSSKEIDAIPPRVRHSPCFELFFKCYQEGHRLLIIDFPESCLELDGKYSSLMVTNECLAMVRYQ